MRIGFISTRLAGTDGVSLETAKLATVLARLGHECFYCAGELAADLPGLAAVELHFRHETALKLYDRAFVAGEPAATLLPDIYDQADRLKRPLRQFLHDYRIEYVIAQNIFAIPMQLPLARALTELMVELSLPGLAHNHDFYWERERFLDSQIDGYLDRYFPPALPHLQQAVINSLAGEALLARRGLSSILIPNVFDFATPAPGFDDYNADFRQAIRLEPSDWLILQPTRVIPRKGIELAIELVARLADSRAKLVITHEAGDEGLAYLAQLQRQAQASGVDLRYVAERIGDSRQRQLGRKIYSLWDAYPHADLITYPSLIEGFGNALLETIYFRRPALVNNYPVYAADIGPLGFQFSLIDSVLTDEAVAQARAWLEQPELAGAATAHNYALGAEHFSYEALQSVLEKCLTVIQT